MNTTKLESHGAVAGQVDCRVRPLVAERVAYGAAGAIPLVDETTTGNVFENAIRRIGAVAACEWFGHAPDSEFTRETIRVLQQRAGVRPNVADKRHGTVLRDGSA
jgi:hypothetical protein